MKKLMHKMRRNHAFTLIELMIVVTIVAILALIAIPLYSQQTTGAVMSEGVSGCGVVQSALRTYYAQNNTFVGATMASLQNAGILGANDLNGNNFNQASYVISGTTATNYTITATCNGPNAAQSSANGLTYILTNAAGTIGAAGTWLGATQVQ
jgi:prepilin-type N-terminal cleavage/methylation domain-containing protein